MPALFADLALVNGKVRTMNPAQPTAEAIAVGKDRILKVGTNDEINQWIGKNTKIINLNGKTVVPGFIDTHIHVADFGRFLMWLDLKHVKSIKELQSSLKERVQKTSSGKWIIGRGWNQDRFEEKRLPTLSDLDSVSPDNPVILYHESAMMCVVNSKALEMSHITRLTPASMDGAIDRDQKTGELTGIFRDSATDLLWKAVPEPSENELLDATALACKKIAAAGVTSVHWMVLSPVEIPIVEKLYAQGKLPIRVYLIIPVNLLDSVAHFRSTHELSLRIGGVVINADGYLAAKSAALFQPYNGEPQTSGTLLCTQEEIYSAASRILEAGLQPVIHAMGDRAVDAVLTTIEQLTSEASGKGISFRIEQAALLDKMLIERIKKIEVVVSVQPCVAASEFSVWSASENLGPLRARWLYPLKTLLEEGVRVVGGSDCPMEPLSPLLGIQAAVAREFFPEERISVDQALRIYTSDAAYSSGEENIKGSLEEGKLADMVVLSRDPLATAPNKIGDIQVEMTFIGGRMVFKRKNLAS
ncbi:MAG: amidohydrolase [Candidatus Bathyarchaeota archaeon]|nr:amidohydrolase [Candidatus Bathyarchaeota archaeon]